MATENNTAAPAQEEQPKVAPAKEKSDNTDKRLKAAGKEAIKRHGLKTVWVTTDGQAFPQQGDARAHAKELGNDKLIKVSE